MQTFRRIRALYRNIRHGWLSITAYYLVLSALAYAAYHYCAQLPASSSVTASQLWQWPGHPIAGLRHIWWIFVWGFSLQLVIQIGRIFSRQPREAGLALLLKHGLWVSTHAGIFEELIFRLYGFMASVVVLEYLNRFTNNLLHQISSSLILPAANFITLGLLQHQLTQAPWSAGLAVVVGSLFFSSAHLHYGRFSKLNVWFIGLVMFWLTFNYGLLAAILAHITYDFCVYLAIAISSPLQPRQAQANNT